MTLATRTALLGLSLAALSVPAAAQTTAPPWEPKVTPANELTVADAAKIPSMSQQAAHDRLFKLF